MTGHLIELKEFCIYGTEIRAASIVGSAPTVLAAVGLIRRISVSTSMTFSPMLILMG